MTSDVKHLFMFLFALVISSLVESLFKILLIFNWLFVLLSCNILYILWIKVFYQVYNLKIFLPFEAYLFISLLMFLKLKHFKIWWNLIFYFFLLWIVLLGLYLRIICQIQSNEGILLCFTLEILNFKFFNPFWVDNCILCEVKDSVHFFEWIIQLSQNHLLKRHPLPTELSWHFCRN